MSLEAKIDDIYAWQLLSPLVSGYPYLPFTGSAARPLVLAHLLNDIVVNQRRQIIEFGAGISTMLMARLIKRNGLDATLLAIEHEPGWADQVKRMLAAEGIDTAVEIVCAPLVPCKLAKEDQSWYDLAILAERTAGKVFDLAIVDGPPAWQPGKDLARYPAVPFLMDRMAPRCTIYLDDADRPGERAIVAKWNEIGPWRFNITHRSFAFATAGEAYYTQPFVYYS